MSDAARAWDEGYEAGSKDEAYEQRGIGPHDYHENPYAEDATMPLPDAAVIEIVEQTDSPDPGAILPNEIRINGHPVLAPADHPVIVHEIGLSAQELVQVTLTLFAKRVTIGHEPKPTTTAAERGGENAGEGL